MSGQTSPPGAPGFRYPSGPLSDGSMQQAGPSTSLNPTQLLNSFPVARSGLTKDGQPAKRRGPKPDSKPAASKRQQMNRAAQRSHRERKENYIKALEEEVLRFKDVIIQTVREKDAVVNENHRLRALLAEHGINYDHLIAASTASPTSVSGSYATRSEGTALTPATTVSPSSQHQDGSQTSKSPSPPRQTLTMPKNEIDYDQLGIDFVLELERTCMKHLQYLEVRSYNPEGQVHHHPLENPDDSEHVHMSGHALMGSCVPLHHIMNSPGEEYPFQMPNASNEALVTLLNLSAKLPMDREGEITPVMAWSFIFQQSAAAALTQADFKSLAAKLGNKVRCYGFGAVLEEVELQLALDEIMADKNVPQIEAGLARQTLITA